MKKNKHIKALLSLALFGLLSLSFALSLGGLSSVFAATSYESVDATPVNYNGLTNNGVYLYDYNSGSSTGNSDNSFDENWNTNGDTLTYSQLGYSEHYNLSQTLSDPFLMPQIGSSGSITSFYSLMYPEVGSPLASSVYSLPTWSTTDYIKFYAVSTSSPCQDVYVLTLSSTSLNYSPLSVAVSGGFLESGGYAYSWVSMFNSDDTVYYYYICFAYYNSAGTYVGLQKYFWYMTNNTTSTYQYNYVSYGFNNFNYGYEISYDSGYSDGQVAGYQDGYNVGSADGFHDGYYNGKQEEKEYCETEDFWGTYYNNGYADGTTDGIQQGYNTGYDDGFEYAYNEYYQSRYTTGYNDGVKDANADLTGMTLLTVWFGGISSILSIKLFGNVSIGAIVLIVVSFTLLPALIGLLGGGKH